MSLSVRCMAPPPGTLGCAATTASQGARCASVGGTAEPRARRLRLSQTSEMATVDATKHGISHAAGGTALQHQEVVAGGPFVRSHQAGALEPRTRCEIPMPRSAKSPPTALATCAVPGPRSRRQRSADPPLTELTCAGNCKNRYLHFGLRVFRRTCTSGSGFSVDTCTSGSGFSVDTCLR